VNTAHEKGRVYKTFECEKIKWRGGREGGGLLGAKGTTLVISIKKVIGGDTFKILSPPRKLEKNR